MVAVVDAVVSSLHKRLARLIHNPARISFNVCLYDEDLVRTQVNIDFISYIYGMR